jgi:hypothetical protein
LEITQIHKKISKLIPELFMIEEKLGKMKCDSETELKAKKLINECLVSGVSSLMIMVDIMNEVIESKDDVTAMETVGDILANNEPVN